MSARVVACETLTGRPCGSWSAYQAGCRAEPCRIAASEHKSRLLRRLVAVALAGRDEWIDRAACRDEPLELFFPERGGSSAYNRTRAICARCEVVAECLAEAMRLPEQHDAHGFRAGLTSDERRNIRRRQQVNA